MKFKNLALAMFGIAALTPTCNAQAAFVSDTTPTPTLIGSITAGNTYNVSASGIADLFAAFNGGNGVPFTADGKPTYAIPNPYSQFNPNGLDYDPSQGTSAHGVGGAGKLFGALLGTFTPTPSSTSDYFTIGLGTTFQAPSTGMLYALVNDCLNCYFDNSSVGGYNVTLTLQSSVSTVPLPASAPMFGAALAVLGAAGFRFRRKQMSGRV